MLKKMLSLFFKFVELNNVEKNIEISPRQKLIFPLFAIINDLTFYLL